MVDADIEALKHEGKPWIDQPELKDWPRLDLPQA
jgi:GDPmannose 4,6-dehydratase